MQFSSEPRNLASTQSQESLLKTLTHFIRRHLANLTRTVEELSPSQSNSTKA